MKNYEDMSDFELSSELMVAIYSKEVKCCELSADGKSIYHCGPTGEGFYELQLIDINNPSDIMPIAIENKISIVFDGEFTGACNMPDKYQYPDNHNGSGNISVHCPENVLRAIATCFLKMKELEE